MLMLMMLAMTMFVHQCLPMIIPLCLLPSQSYAAIQHDDEDYELLNEPTWNVSGKTESEKTIATVLSFLALLLLLPVVVVRCVHVVVVIVVVVVDAIFPFVPDNDNFVFLSNDCQKRQ